MKLALGLVVVGLVLVAEARVFRRQVQSGDLDSDSFWENFQPRPTTTARPARPSQQQQRCIDNCPATPEYNPVCGSNGQQYNNIGRLRCAKNCGVAVDVQTFAACQPLT